MAGRRLYITIPQRDWELLRRVGVLEGHCPGYVARRIVLTELYRAIGRSPELQAYDAVLAAEERNRVLEDGRTH